MIRIANEADVHAMLELYAPYVTDTAITFEYDIPSEAEFLERFRGITAFYPWIVYEEDGKILGYAYASQAFARTAYNWDADMSVYLCEVAKGRGVGTKLYDCLHELLKDMGILVCYALITGDNDKSIRFHEKEGYTREGFFEKSGFKFGKWYDLAWYTKRLSGTQCPKEMPKAFRANTYTKEIIEKHNAMK